jgi:hypothetical protein
LNLTKTESYYFKEKILNNMVRDSSVEFSRASMRLVDILNIAINKGQGKKSLRA